MPARTALLVCTTRGTACQWHHVRCCQCCFVCRLHLDKLLLLLPVLSIACSTHVLSFADPCSFEQVAADLQQHWADQAAQQPQIADQQTPQNRNTEAVVKTSTSPELFPSTSQSLQRSLHGSLSSDQPFSEAGVARQHEQVACRYTQS